MSDSQLSRLLVRRRLLWYVVVLSRHTPVADPISLRRRDSGAEGRVLPKPPQSDHCYPKFRGWLQHPLFLCPPGSPYTFCSTRCQTSSTNPLKAYLGTSQCYPAHSLHVRAVPVSPFFPSVLTLKAQTATSRSRTTARAADHCANISRARPFIMTRQLVFGQRTCTWPSVLLTRF